MPDRALLIGINDYKNVSGLLGCLNDVHGMAELLIGTFGFPGLPLDAPDSAIHTLTDDKAIKTTITGEVKDWLFQGASAGDCLIFHFAGHGSQIPDDTGQETDGLDEILCLWDMDPEFQDRDTFLTDKEIAKLFATLPRGAQLLSVFDSCHSGTGTRRLSAPMSRALGFTEDRRPLLTKDSPNPSQARLRNISQYSDPEEIHRQSGVRYARYIEPPADMLQLVQERRKKVRVQRGFSARVLVQVPNLNNILYAACRDDQTAADASIADGSTSSSHGAFTFYLCKNLQGLGQDVDRAILDKHVTDDLRQYGQEPQLESASKMGPLFTGDGVAPDTGFDAGRVGHHPKPVLPGSTPSPGGAPIQPEILFELIQAYNRLLDLAQGIPTAGRGLDLWRQLRRGVTGKVLVTVHGIGTHLRGYSNEWWNALSPYAPSLQPGDLDSSRQEVLWSNIVNDRTLTRAVDKGQAGTLTEEIKETLRALAQQDLDSVVVPAPVAAGVASPRDLNERQARVREARSRRDLSIPNIGSIDDFVNYLINGNIRARVLDQFFQVVRPFLQAGTEIEIISHSWGTVVAYEGLLRLESEGGITGRVHNLFTVGAALSIWPVKKMLIPEAKTGRRPSMVERWVNLDARFDVVGGNLQGNPYNVDEEFLSLDPVGCSPPWLPQPACSHSSYFNASNFAVNRDIFGRFIES